MTFEDMKKIVVDTLNCEEEKVTMEASLTEDLEADSLDAVGAEHGSGGRFRRFHPRRGAGQHEDRRRHLQLPDCTR